MQRENTKRRLFSNPRFLVIALALAVVFAAVVGTLAWLRHMRSMQTVTLIRVSDRYLLGSDGSNTSAVNLGSIDVSEPGSRSYAFGVKSGSDYRLQLAYTTLFIPSTPPSEALPQARATPKNIWKAAIPSIIKPRQSRVRL